MRLKFAIVKRVISITTEDGKTVAVVSTVEQAQRLVACWNACEGISIEVLQDPDIILHPWSREAEPEEPER